jgi:hypothetical protein
MEHNMIEPKLQEKTLSDGSKVYDVVCETLIIGCDSMASAMTLQTLIERHVSSVECICEDKPAPKVGRKGYVATRAKIKVYKDIDDYGPYYTVYDHDCEGSYLPDDIRIKELEAMGDDEVEWLDGIDNRD